MEIKLYFETNSTINLCPRVAQYQELEALSVKIQAHLIQAVDLAFGGIRIPLYYGMPMH